MTNPRRRSDHVFEEISDTETTVSCHHATSPDIRQPGFSELTQTFLGVPASLLGERQEQTLQHAGDSNPTMAATRGSLTPLPHAAVNEGPLKIGDAFGARYQIISLLGLGGMGAVYKAWDAELGEIVALKVVRPEIAADPEAARLMERRFKQELLLARKVTHKNVVRIHDLGEERGIKYITMPFVGGEDLATVLTRETRLPVARALKIARGIVAGLRAAHAAEVVHRDLKPANIMVTADTALIMDFGVARSAGSTAGHAGAPGLPSFQGLAVSAQTVAGAIVGTVEYMAPEQAKAQPVDQRADIYAFGLIFYDILVGRQRFAGVESAIAELTGRMLAPPPSARSIDPRIPEKLDALISRCLQPDPAARFQTTQDLLSELKRLDDEGKPLPALRRLTGGMMAAVVVLALLLVAGTFYTAQWLMTPVKPHDPVLVVIADFQNNTKNPAFDHALEPTLRRGLEVASFINAYDRSRIRQTFGVRPPEKWDAAAARELAVKQGVGVVLSGSIGPSGDGYEIAVNAAQAMTSNAIATARGYASTKDDVLAVTTKLVTTIRKALGDKSSDSAQLFAMRTLSTTSLEVVSEYATGLEAQTRGKYEEAAQYFLRAVKQDPKFGLGYAGLAAMSLNLGRSQDAENYNKQALSHLDTVTERERFVIRALYYTTSGDYQQCVKEYGDLITRYSGNAIGYNNRANCLSRLRNMREAVSDVREAVRILPRVPMFRGNLAAYSAYAGDFTGAEQEAQALAEPTDLSTVALAFALVGQGRLADATATYEKLATINARGASRAAAGLADLALYEGRFADAARLFEQGAASDLVAKNAERAARKLTSLAYTQLLRGRKTEAVAAAEEALTTSQTVPVRFLAARVLVEADALARARTLAAGLAAELPAEPQAYGKIIEAEVSLKSGDARQAVKILSDANSTLDTWLGHFDLGRAYLELGAYPQADSEFDRCIKRRGEALSLLVDEEATYGFFPVVYYYQGRVREALNNARFADSYGEYVKIRGNSTEDSLLRDVRKRIGR